MKFALSIPVLSVVLFSFLSSNNSKTPTIPNEWVQYLGEDSIKYVYTFKDSLGCKILQKVVVEEPNKGNGGKKIFSNTLLFDASGKIKRVGVTRSVSLVEYKYENGKTQTAYSYDEDVISFKKDSLASLKLSNSGKLVLSLSRFNSYLYDNSGSLYRPVYNFSDLTRRVECKYIGKGVDPKLDIREFYKQTGKGIYRKYRKPLKTKETTKTKSINTIQVEK